MIKVLETNELFDIGDNGEIKNVVFGLYAVEDITAANGAVIPADGLIEVITFDESGLATVQTDLPLGGYYVKEIATDEHYIPLKKPVHCCISLVLLTTSGIPGN